LGFEGPLSGGKHRFMKKGTLKVSIPSPHGSDAIGVPLLKEILKQAEISYDDWNNV
jgi:YcfA-like protein.